MVLSCSMVAIHVMLLMADLDVCISTFDVGMCMIFGLVVVVFLLCSEWWISC